MMERPERLETETPPEVNSSVNLDVLSERVTRLAELFTMRWNSHGDVHILLDRMMAEFKGTVEAKLELLNQVRQQTIQDRGEFLKVDFRNYYQEQHRALENRVVDGEKQQVNRSEYEKREQTLEARLEKSETEYRQTISTLERTTREKMDLLKEASDKKVDAVRDALVEKIDALKPILYMMAGGWAVIEVLLRFVHR